MVTDSNYRRRMKKHLFHNDMDQRKLDNTERLHDNMDAKRAGMKASARERAAENNAAKDQRRMEKDALTERLITATERIATALAPARKSKMEEIKELNQMKEDGLLTEEEFVSQKKKVLGRD
jgi:hypothetical protein